jgi:predicted DNA-binding transcriptional regulator YafY
MAMKSDVSDATNIQQLTGEKIPKMARIKEIFVRLHRGVLPKKKDLARDLNVDERTIGRDIADMKSIFNLPIEYSAEYRGYRLTAIVDEMPTMDNVHEDDMLAFSVAMKALLEYKDTPFYQDLEKIFKHLLTFSSKQMIKKTEVAFNNVTFLNNRHRAYNTDNFMALIKASINKEKVKVSYRNNKQKNSTQIVHPYHFFCTSGRWYMIAYSEKHQEIRNYSMARVGDGKVLNLKENFEVVDFNPDIHFKNAIGAFTGTGQEYHAVIEFDYFAGPIVQERIWNPTTKFIKLKNGGVRMEITVPHLEDLKNEVLAWGSRAVVIEPLELKETMIAEAKNMLNNYQ